MDLKWALAFSEAEGSFFIAIIREAKSERGFYPRPRFSITLLKDDRLLLEIIAALFQKYEILSNLQPAGKTSVILSVRGVNQCRKLADLFMPMRWYTTKRRDFLIWEFALKLFEEIKKLPGTGSRRKWTDQRIYDMAYLRHFMNSLKKQPLARKREETILQWGLEPSEFVIAFLTSLGLDIHGS